MAIIQNAMAQGAAQPVPQPSAQPKAASASDYARVIAAASRLMYDPTSVKKLLKMMSDLKHPAFSLASATLLIFSEVSARAKNMPQAVKIAAVKEIMHLLAELAEKSGHIKETPATIKEASMMIGEAMLKAKGIDPKSLTPEVMAKARQDAPTPTFTPFLYKR